MGRGQPRVGRGQLRVGRGQLRVGRGQPRVGRGQPHVSRGQPRLGRGQAPSSDRQSVGHRCICTSPRNSNWFTVTVIQCAMCLHCILKM